MPAIKWRVILSINIARPTDGTQQIGQDPTGEEDNVEAKCLRQKEM
jgi:hypothetical protein